MSKPECSDRVPQECLQRTARHAGAGPSGLDALPSPERREKWLVALRYHTKAAQPATAIRMPSASELPNNDFMAHTVRCDSRDDHSKSLKTLLSEFDRHNTCGKIAGNCDCQVFYAKFD